MFNCITPQSINILWLCSKAVEDGIYIYNCGQNLWSVIAQPHTDRISIGVFLKCDWIIYVNQKCNDWSEIYITITDAWK